MPYELQEVLEVTVLHSQTQRSIILIQPLSLFAILYCTLLCFIPFT